MTCEYIDYVTVLNDLEANLKNRTETVSIDKIKQDSFLAGYRAAIADVENMFKSQFYKNTLNIPYSYDDGARDLLIKIIKQLNIDGQDIMNCELDVDQMAEMFVSNIRKEFKVNERIRNS